MSTIGTLAVNITASNESLAKRLKASKRELDRFKKSVESTFNSIGQKAGTALKWMTGGLLAFGAVAIKAFADAETQAAQLKATLDDLGQGQHFQALMQYSSALQGITRHGDDVTQSLMALGLNMGVGIGQIQEATRAAMGLSAAYGIELNQAMKMVAMAMQGNTEMLARYIPQVRNVESATEKMRLVNEAATRGFKIEQEQAQTTAGKLMQLKNAIGDLVEMIGERLLGSLNDSSSLFSTLVTYVQAATIWVQNLTDRQIGLIKTWAGIGLGILAFLALVPKVISAVKGMIAVYRALAASKALANPALAVAGVVAAGAVMVGSAYIAGLADETADAFGGSWDQAMNEANKRLKDLQTNANKGIELQVQQSAASGSPTVAQSQQAAAQTQTRQVERQSNNDDELLAVARKIELNTAPLIKQAIRFGF